LIILGNKSNPEYEKSKLIFEPTSAGKKYAVPMLKVDLEDVIKVDSDEEIVNYRLSRNQPFF
jgi:hypothetical protein